MPFSTLEMPRLELACGGCGAEGDVVWGRLRSQDLEGAGNGGLLGLCVCRGDSDGSLSARREKDKRGRGVVGMRRSEKLCVSRGSGLE